MKFQLFIAFRYLIAKKSNNIINWITWISVIVVSIVTAALIIILSAMNGLSDSVMDLYSDFDPDLKVSAAEGKRIQLNTINYNEIESIPGIQHIAQSIEETVLLKYRDRQEVATLKGVSNNFDSIADLNKNMVDGFYGTFGNGQEMCVMGTDLALKLGININLFEPVLINVPNMEGSGFPGEFFKSTAVKPVGVFDITSDFNSKFVIVSQNIAEHLLGIENQVTSLEISINKNANVQVVKKQLQNTLGSNFIVKTRFEQNEFLFRSINAEKWITLLILSLVVVLAVFNVVGSLTILIIDKSRDIYVLRSMGTSLNNIRTIFWLEGFIISLVGSLIGLSIGLLACWAQNKFCFFGYGSVGRIECFPVLIQPLDVFLVFLMVNGIAVLTSFAPVFKIGSDIKS